MSLATPNWATLRPLSYTLQPLSYDAPYWAKLHPILIYAVPFRMTKQPLGYAAAYWAMLHPLSCAATQTKLPSFVECRTIQYEMNKMMRELVWYRNKET